MDQPERAIPALFRLHQPPGGAARRRRGRADDGACRSAARLEPTRRPDRRPATSPTCASGSLQVVASENVLLGRDAGGLYAMTRVCTHQGQLVSILTVGSATVLHCYGHGSEFTINGAVTTGPATQPLEHLRVDLAADGSITIQADQFVTADTRTPVG